NYRPLSLLRPAKVGKRQGRCAGSQIRLAVHAHAARLELGANGYRVLASRANSFCRSPAVENDPLRVGIECRAALVLPGKMELHPRILVRCSINKSHAPQVERQAISEFEEHRVTQVLARITKDPKRFTSYSDKDVLRQIFCG